MRPRVPGHPEGPKIALLYPGDADLRARADPHESRFAALFAAFDAAGVHAEPVVWHPEAADAVLSDDAIVTRLKDANIDIARRTVAKYRESLRIPSSVERRREKAALAAQPA